MSITEEGKVLKLVTKGKSKGRIFKWKEGKTGEGGESCGKGGVFDDNVGDEEGREEGGK